MNDELPQQHTPIGFYLAAVIVVCIAIGFSLLFRSAINPALTAQMGQDFPPIEAAGWINEPGPIAEDLRSHVLVVDAWAFWCGPCRSATPYLLELHEKYQDRGVIFLGLTSEGLDSQSIKLSRQFVKSEKVPWPNGYGATKTLAALNVETIPQFWVVDRQNKIVCHEQGFSGNSIENMERAIIKALEASAAGVIK